MNAIILSIGDELALGQTVDTNSAYIAQQLSAVGCDATQHRTVADDQAAIAAAMKDCAEEADVLIVSGGIGPTEDDLTRDALSDVLAAPLEIYPPALQRLEAFFKKLNRPMPERNKVQALLPRGASSIDNPNGTAPGIRAEYKRGAHDRLARRGALGRDPSTGPCTIFVMPGVPKEMKPMLRDHVLPFVREKSGGAAILQKTLHTFGAGESTIAEKLGPLMQRGRNPSVGTTVSGGAVSLRINARFDSVARAQAEMDDTVAACRAACGDLIYGEDGQSLAEAVAALLLSRADVAAGAPVTVATAESCTGGLLAKMLTDVAGSSAYFTQGWITYTNAAKESQLGVASATLVAHGAVSESVVREMAEGAAARAGAGVALSISGIAGPGGGTETKPVGTVCIALAHAGGTDARTFQFPGDRETVRDRAAKMALSMLRFHLLGKPMPV
ncbi:MAG TPA: nicotinamide-nucleotide amidohydrolase family protein [Tepidisphaeraceae bacterium]|jgi:nicotinamide-nucleotide amidase